MPQKGQNSPFLGQEFKSPLFLVNNRTKMDKENFKNIIKSELEKPINKYSNILKSCRVDVTENIPEPEIAWELKEEEENFNIIGTHGNFSLIKGKAKSKKSFFINMALASAVGEGLLQNKLRSPLNNENNHVLYFDTEQSKYHVQKAIKRLCEQINIDVPNNLDTYSLRKLSPSERLKSIEYSIMNTPNIGFVVIDGIRDLITSINDEAESCNISSNLLKWTEELNIHITVVLHENPGSDKARGHLGTELTNKAETVITIVVDKNNKDVSIVSASHSRNKEFLPFAFSIDDNGVPTIIHDYEINIKTSKNKFDVLTLDSQDKFKIINEVYNNNQSFMHGELVKQIKLYLDKNYKGNTGKGTNKIKMLISEAKESGWLMQNGERQPYTLGKLSV